MSSRRIAQILVTATAITLLLILPAYTITRSMFEQYWQLNHTAKETK